VLPVISAQADMGVYPATSSTLQGPSVPINNDVQLHRLFERNESAYPENMAVMHGGTYLHGNVFFYFSIRHKKIAFTISHN